MESRLVECQASWESGKVFAKVKLSRSAKVQALRRRLEEDGFLPKGLAKFVAGNSVLNDVQESLCGVGVFGQGPVLRVTLRPQTTSTTTATTPSQKSNADLLQQFSQLRMDKTKLVEDLSQILGKMISYGGRRTFENIIERFDEHSQDQLSISQVVQLCKDGVKRNKAFQFRFAAEEIEADLCEFEKSNRNTFLTYLEFAQCLPKHLQQQEGGLSPHLQQTFHNEDKPVIDSIKEKLAALENAGSVKLSLSMSELVRGGRKKGNSEWNNVFGSRESKMDSSRTMYYYAALDMEGYIVESGMRDQVQFEASVDLHAMFSALDKNKTGSISFLDMEMVLDKLGCGKKALNVPGEKIREALEPFHSRGWYEYPAFLDFCFPLSKVERAARFESTIAKLREVYNRKSFGGSNPSRFFRNYDPAGKGTVSVDMLKQCLREELDLQLSSKDAIALVERFDPDHTNQVSYSSFLACLQPHGAAGANTFQLKQQLVHALRDQFLNVYTGEVDYEKAFRFLAERESKIGKPVAMATLESMVAAFQSVLDLKSNNKTIRPKPEELGYSEALAKLLEREPSLKETSQLFRVLNCFPLMRSSRSLARTSAGPGFDRPEMNLECITKILQSDESPCGNTVAKKIRDAIRETCGRGKYDLAMIYEALFATLDDRALEERVLDSKTRFKARCDPRSSDSISVYSLVRGCKSCLGLELRVEEAFVFLTNRNQGETIPSPCGLQEFVEFVQPESKRSSVEIAAQLRRALKVKSIGGMRIRQLFQQHDHSRRGTLSLKDVEEGLASMDLGISRRDIQSLLRSDELRIDRKTNQLSIDEFIRFALATY